MQDNSWAAPLLEKLGATFSEYLESPERHPWLQTAVQQAGVRNGWFTEREVHHAFEAWAHALQPDSIQRWLSDAKTGTPSKVALILAGNIPMVGLHDILAVMVSGHHAAVKCSSTDDVLIPAILHEMSDWNSEVGERINIVQGKLEDYDAVIATGSNNSARHFEAYFSHVPHIIRKNRTSVAVLDGTESGEEMAGLMADCFTYYGLGCRNVTKLYVPKDYNLNRVFEASVPYAYMMDNKKYHNNYNYYKALMMLEREEFLENDLIILRKQPPLFSPVSVLNYEYYDDRTRLDSMLKAMADDIQCTVGKEFTAFGTAQKPGLTDYADGVNTLEFLSKIERS